MGDGITQKDWGKVVAELVGTFFFFFIGFGSIILTAGVAKPTPEQAWLQLFIAAIAHGLALALAVSALGHISGGHFNPAVTISMMATRNISAILGLLYIVAQILGGVLSLLALQLVMPNPPTSAVTPAPGAGVSFFQATLFEAILTFFLVLVIFGTAVDNRGAKVGGFAIGLTIFVDILVGGPFTGAQMNPAHAISAELVNGSFDANILIYWIGPIIGAVLAALLYSGLFLPKDRPETTEPPASEPGLLKKG
jgi:MIP family channel proteins